LISSLSLRTIPIIKTEVVMGSGTADEKANGFVIAEMTDSSGARRLLSLPRARSLLAAAALFACASAAAVGFIDGPKLVGTGVVGSSGAQQGFAVAISRDGSTALVGGPYDSANVGAAWVFVLQGGAWTQQKKLLATDPVGAAWQGASVALSADGNTALVGGPLDNGNAGAAWVFTRSGTTWTQQKKLVANNPVGAAEQGYSVALSADGSTALVGAVFDNNQTGAAWVFVRSVGTWSQQYKLFANNASNLALQGYAVALSADGNTALVGGAGDTNSAGGAWVFTRSGVTWTQMDKLLGTTVHGNLNQGESVALSADGGTALVGGDCVYGAFCAGSAFVFTGGAGHFTQQGNELHVAVAGFGNSVALSADGNRALVGAPGEAGISPSSVAGSAYVFNRSNGAWSQEGGKLVGQGDDGPVQDRGFSVALSGDGNTALVGGPYDYQMLTAPTTYTGAAWVFMRSCTANVNADGLTNVADVFYLINFLFAGGPAPVCQ
jgi:hypothetical protein